MIKKLAVIGVGLIGGSMASALRQEGVVQEVVGCGRSQSNLDKAVSLGVIDHYTHDPATAVKGADLVVLAVPLGAMETTFRQIQPALAEDAVITDVGSVKGSVIEDARRVFGEVPSNFVAGHPIAGTERSGVEAAFPELFRNRRVILTPLDHTDADAIRRIEQIWRYCGAEVSFMSVSHHDEILAATSHLPHMLAYTLVDSLARLKENDEVFRYAAGGFRDFTRIASSNPGMWRDICLANREPLGEMLKRFVEELQQLAQILDSGDAQGLLQIFERAKSARDRYIDGVNATGNESKTE